MKYSENQRIIDRLAEMVCQHSGEKAWSEAAFCNMPTGNMNHEELSISFQQLLNKLEITQGKETTREIMHSVKHGLTRDHYNTARDDFLKFNNIDCFSNYIWRRQISMLKECLKLNKLFFNQLINEAAYRYACGISELFFGKRQGNRIVAQAIPYQLIEYLETDDLIKQRYHMCHCQFARESILMVKTVSDSMCFCSMGHVKLFWETALDTDLQGEVVTSALKGDTTCVFVFYLPDEIMKKYVA